ncbi:BRCT domain-containing protein [bacterium]|nr:BRCT domain-containing protein [bacterium]
MHPDQLPYYRFCSRSMLDKSINSLLGLVEGVSIDGAVSDQEIDYLIQWVHDHRQYQDRHPFNELLPVVAEAVADRVLTEEERYDIIWLCENLRSTEYFDLGTADIQRLHALVSSIAADGIITKEELEGLSSWLEEHDYLRSCWPYDEIEGLVAAVLDDGKIDEREHEALLSFFSEFTETQGKKTLDIDRSMITVQGVCAFCPEITIPNSVVCFTGASSRYTRDEFERIVSDAGGRPVRNVSGKLDYLVIGADGNPCWAYACYGRKVEKAVELRKSGCKLLLVHENDFQDALADSLGL